MGRELRQFRVYAQSIIDSSAVVKALGCSWNLEGKFLGHSFCCISLMS
jgi:hypothetical protein